MKNRIVSITLTVILTLSIGVVGCASEEVQEITEYSLTISSMEGGSVTEPGEGTFAYDKGNRAILLASADEGYRFVNWTGDVSAIGNANAALATITMHDDYEIIANFALETLEIHDWYDLDAIRDNPDGSYVLMSDLDATTPGYVELASETADQGRGWWPIGTGYIYPHEPYIHLAPFTGTFDGQSHEIRDLFISRPDENGVGLFGFLDEGGSVQNLNVVDARVTAEGYVGILVGWNHWGTVRRSYSSGSVAGGWGTGGLTGANRGTVSHCCSNASVVGGWGSGGLTGDSFGGVLMNSYFIGSVKGDEVGGLVGWNAPGTVSNSHYSYHEVLLNGQNMITIGALFDEDFDQWLANDKFLDINERLSEEDGYYLTNNISDFKQLLAFGQNGALKFRLTTDLDLRNDPNFYIPYLAGEFDGNGHRLSNLSIDFDSAAQVGLFGCVDFGGDVSRVGVENLKITGNRFVGGLVGTNQGGTVSNSYATGNLIGVWYVGGLVGHNLGGTVSDSYCTGSVTGDMYVGGLVGLGPYGVVSNSFWDTETGGQAASAGGTGKTTAEMKNITTFSAAGWNITAVASGERNSSCIWNIVDGQTYPFLSWQPIS